MSGEGREARPLDGTSRLLTVPFLRLWVLGFVTFFAAFQLFPTIPFRVLALGGSQAQAGAFLGVYTWASALSAPLTGALADRLGRRRVMVLAAVSFVGFTVLYGVVTSLPLFLVVGAFHGVFWSGLLSASSAAIVDVIPAERRTAGLGYWGMAPTGAIAIAPAVGLELYEFGWEAMIGEVVVLSLLVVGLALAVREQPPGGGEARPAGLGLRWRVLAASATLFLVSFGYGGATSYVALLARERSIEPASLFFTGFAVTVLVSRVTLVRHADRWRIERFLVLSLLAIPPGLLLVATAESAARLAFGAVVFGVGFGNAYPAFMTWLLERTDPARRATTFGTVLFALDIGIGSGSLLLGVLVGARGFTSAFVFAAAVAALSPLAFWAGGRLLPRSAS